MQSGEHLPKRWQETCLSRCPWHGKKNVQRDAQSICDMNVTIANGIGNQRISLHMRRKLSWRSYTDW